MRIPSDIGPLIRRLVPADIGASRPLMLEAYDAHPDAFTSSVAERSALPLSWWASRLRDDPCASEMVIGAFARDALVGVAGLAFESREKAKHKATLFGMYVPAAHRNRGLGRRLVIEALAHAKDRPVTRLVRLTGRQQRSRRSALRELRLVHWRGAVRVAVETGSLKNMWCPARISEPFAARESSPRCANIAASPPGAADARHPLRRHSHAGA
jgi:GNAT superfamily N-acetyltransferase